MINYNTSRESILKSVSNNYAAPLSAVEKKADKVMERMRNEFKEKHTEKGLYKMDMLNDESLRNCELYKVIDEMPKGSDLHVHGLCLMPAKEFVDFLIGNENVFVDYKGETHGKLYSGDNRELRKKGFVTVKELLDSGKATREELEKMWTLRGCPQDTRAWDYFEVLFMQHADLDGRMDVFEDYYYHAFLYYLKHNILHVEPRVLLFGSHEEVIEKMEAIKRAYHRVRKLDDDFSCTVIGAGLKHKNLPYELSVKMLENADYATKHVFDDYEPGKRIRFVGGGDLVNEEDMSKPLKVFYKDIIDLTTKSKTLNLYLHAGESLHPDSSNILDAYFYNSRRIGHGFNLFRFPALYEKLIDNDVCLEVCPISNRTLGYIDDLRLHPAIGYMNSGVPMVLCSDDPGYQEITALTDDFFAAAVCWDLNLAQMKKLIRNSIEYSALSPTQKVRLRKAWTKRFVEFAEKVSLM